MDHVQRIENVYDVTKRLLGLIVPIGESSPDEVRFENLQQTKNLIVKLVNDVMYVETLKDSKQYSLNKAGVDASLFLDYLREMLNCSSNNIRVKNNRIKILTTKTKPFLAESSVIYLLEFNGKLKPYVSTIDGKILPLVESTGLCKDIIIEKKPVKFHKLFALPEITEPNSVYLIYCHSYAEGFIVDYKNELHKLADVIDTEYNDLFKLLNNGK